jgi:precorrin-4/cobalt-precorrin-4 C11-methyltransferase
MVYFVGAGCGAKDLITVRGRDLIAKADVVIYAGSLVNPELLEYAKEGCKIYNSAYMDRNEIIEVIKEAENDGLMTVRLHTGDPAIYSAAREQIDRLEELGIKCETCPGVTACFGAAADMGVEYTLPGVSQTLIITRMEGKTPVPDRESIKSLAAHKTSMAVYLSAGLTKELSKQLIEGGYPPETPAAIVYKATWPEEKIVRCTVATLDEAATANGIGKTAVMLIGDAISQENYEKSHLYSPYFETEYRKMKER